MLGPFRPFLRAFAVLVLLIGSAAAAPASPARDLEFLEAVTWGATGASYEELTRLGRERWLEHQLAPTETRLPAPQQATVDALRVSTTPPLALIADFAGRAKAVQEMPNGAEKDAAVLANLRAMSEIANQAAIRSVLRAIYAPDQLRERLTWFWVNHFPVYQGKANVRVLVGDYEDKAIRPHALGRFRDLLGATLRHPAMLRYLDNAQNVAGRINENYARELLELQTIGLGSGYTQKDIEELARVLTGFGIEPGETPRLPPERAAQYQRDGLFAFNPARHDFGDKVVLGHTIKGRGAEEADEVLDILARHPATARRVATRLATYFMSDAPAPNVVEAMSREYLRTDGSIPAMLRVLFRSPEFERALGQRPKDATRYVYSALRLAYEDQPILNALPAQGWLLRLGAGLWYQQTPDGYPLTSDAWTGPGQMTARFEFARAIGSGPAGFFTIGDGKVEKPGFPVVRNALFYAAWRPRLSAKTREALDQAISPQDWNTLFLSSPEFMQGGSAP